MFDFCLIFLFLIKPLEYFKVANCVHLLQRYVFSIKVHFRGEFHYIGQVGYQNIMFGPIRNQKSLITILIFNYMFIKNFNKFLQNILNEIFAASKNCITKFIMYTLPVREIENQEWWTSTYFSYRSINKFHYPYRFVSWRVIQKNCRTRHWNRYIFKLKYQQLTLY